MIEGLKTTWTRRSVNNHSAEDEIGQRMLPSVRMSESMSSSCKLYEPTHLKSVTVMPKKVIQTNI
jgi:hypothetical protein